MPQQAAVRPLHWGHPDRRDVAWPQPGRPDPFVAPARAALAAPNVGQRHGPNNAGRPVAASLTWHNYPIVVWATGLVRSAHALCGAVVGWGQRLAAHLDTVWWYSARCLRGAVAFFCARTPNAQAIYDQVRAQTLPPTAVTRWVGAKQVLRDAQMGVLDWAEALRWVSHDALARAARARPWECKPTQRLGDAPLRGLAACTREQAASLLALGLLPAPLLLRHIDALPAPSGARWFSVLLDARLLSCDATTCRLVTQNDFSWAPLVAQFGLLAVARVAKQANDEALLAHLLGQLRYEDAAALVTHRIATATQAMRWLPRAEVERACDQGLLSYRACAPYLRRPSLAHARVLVLNGMLGWQDWLVSWPLDANDPDLKALVSERAIGPECLSPLLPWRTGGALAAQLYECGRIHAVELLEWTARFWRPQGPYLPPAVQRALHNLYLDKRRPAALPALLDNIPLPHADEELTALHVERRQQYLAMVVATFLSGPAAAEASSLTAMLARLRSWPTSRRTATALAPSEAPAPLATCAACLEESPSTDLVRLSACAHAPEYDEACYAQALAATGDYRCPTAGCDRPLGVRDAQQLRLDGEQVVSLAMNVFRQARQALPQWTPCRDRQCAGGTVQPLSAQPSCRCCRLPLAEPGRIRFDQLSADDRALVRRLVHDMEQTSSSAALEARPVRECYHCGTPTEHREACMHMRCAAPSCRQDWHFNSGPYLAGLPTQYQIAPATYVPRQSLLVDLGLYEGLTPGQTAVLVAPLLRRNLQRLEAQQAPEPIQVPTAPPPRWWLPRQDAPLGPLAA